MKKLIAKMDIPLLIITIAFLVLGLVMVFSASSVAAVLRYAVKSNHFFMRQLLFIIAAIIVGFFIVLRIPTKKYKILAPMLTVGIIVSLIGLFAYGYVSNGAQSWYDLKVFSFQPSEFAKTTIIMFMAVFYNQLIKTKQRDPYASLIPLGVGAVIAVLVLMQPDLGGAIIIVGVTFLVFLSVPLRKNNRIKIFKTIGIATIIGAFILLNSGVSFLNSMQMNRLQYKNPCSRYTADTGYQVCNGFIAINNGGLFGAGLGKSTQKYLYLPEAHTDFIFPIIVEELGLIFGVLVILGYGLMLYRILKIAKEAHNLRDSILAYGAFSLILLHILVNFLGVLALIPLTGVPLPLLSYGGSSTLNTILVLFIVQRVAIETKNNKLKKELANL